ncbi:DegV family protein [Arthrobacter pigmenti]
MPTGSTPRDGANQRPLTGWLDRVALRRQPAAAAGETPRRREPRRVAVVTDSAAALPEAWVRDAQARGAFSVVPMPVMIDGDIFGEGVDELQDQLHRALASGRPVQTSRPSPGQFTRLYGELAAAGFAGVVSFHISASLSGTTDAARLAASSAAIPVEVVDLRTVGMAQGFGVQAALAVAEAGGTMEAVADAGRIAETCSVYFYVPSLEQLRRGGRIGAAASWFGTVLSIKPILGIRDGLVVPVERVRSVPRAVGRLEELAMAAMDDAGAPPRWAVHHFGNQELAQELSIRLGLRTNASGGGQLTSLPAVLAAHTGLGALGVVTVGSSGPDSSSTPGP